MHITTTQGKVMVKSAWLQSNIKIHNIECLKSGVIINIIRYKTQTNPKNCMSMTDYMLFKLRKVRKKKNL